jgi:hypothetical protein
MKLGLFFVLVAVTALGCVPLAESTGEITYACTSRNGRGLCTHYEERETTMDQWLRAASDERAREEAYKKGEPFFPSEMPGETPDHYVQRMDEERRRLDAYRNGDAFFPDHQAGESREDYLKRVDEDRRRGDSYRKGEPVVPSMGSGR